MRRKIQSLLLALLFVSTFAFNNASAQVTVVSGGGLAASYTSLTKADGLFNALNTTGTGAVVVTITGDVTDEPGTIALNNSAAWTSLSITPSGGAARTISGAAVAGSPLIDLNGADNVTINGLNTGGNSLTISNTTVSATSGTSTIRFQADAKNNTITNCSVLGSSTMAVGTNGGNIYFGAAAVTDGNDNNTISNCNIGPAGANLPTKGIYGNGSTTSTTTYNSGIVITGNNIFDYFGAAVQSAGIYVAGGNTDWTISNNKLYQTASRTQTTGSIHAGIHLASANINNCTISGNTVGYSASNGTGTYTFVGIGSASRFYPIYISAHGTVTATSIQGNTVTAISVSGAVSGTSTSSPFAGILTTSGLQDIGTVTGNTIGSTTISGAITISSSSASTGEYYGIYFFPSAVANISNNIVGGISATNTSTGSAAIYGIRAFTSSTVINTMQNNTVGYSAAPLNANATGTASKVVGIYSQSGASILTGNTVTNLTNNGPNVGTGTGSSIIGIWSDNSSATIGNNVAQNVIHTLSNTNATAAVWVTGLSYNGSTTGTHVVQRNFIHSLNISSSSSTATMNGIYIVGGATTYQNNMIRLGIDAAGASITSGIAIFGISEQVAGTDNIYFNSVYIGGTGVDGTANTFAFASTITTNIRAYRDNIFYNARSNGAGTGKHYAVRVGGTAPNPAGLTINNNVYYAPGTGGVFGFFNSLDVPSLASWQTSVGQDVNSFSNNPQYQTPNGTAATVDLHINPSIATIVESNGFDIASITNDYDGQTRSGLTPVDIGADAGNFTPGGDLTAPAISYTNLSNTTSTSNRSLTNVVITDVSGVNGTLGTRPRVYYKRSTDANTYADNTSGSNGWKYAEATGSTSPFDFTINYALLSGGTGVTTGDIVQYFVVAQDLATTPNVGILAGTFNTVPASVALTAGAFPISGSINQYYIVGAPLSGDYTIGVALLNRALGKNITMERVVKRVMREIFVADENADNVKSSEAPVSASVYSSKGKMVMKEVEEVTFVPMENGREYTGPLYSKRSENPELPTDAGVGVYGTITAAVTDLNLRGISGPVRFLLLDATYPTETYPIIINPITGASASNTFTLKPSTGVTSSVSGSFAGGAVIKVMSSYATIDGSNTIGGNTRDLTIENTSVTTPNAVWFASNGASTTTGSGIKNCNIINGVNTSSGVVVSDGTTLGNAGNFTNFTFENNTVQKAYIGVYSNFTVAAGNGSGCVYKSNSLTTSGANSVRYMGIYVQGADGALVTGNEIANFDGTSAEDDKGVWFATGTTNSSIEKNNIHDLVYTGTGGYGGHGCYVSSGLTASNNTVVNNMFANLSGDGWSYTSIPTDNPIGIALIGTQTGVNIYFNSINLYGNTLNQSSAMSMGIYLGAGSVADIRNNSIVNNKGLLSATGYGAAGVYAVTNNAQFSNINNNNYYVNPTGSGVKLVGQIAAAGSADLNAWKAATGQDANSVSGNPNYVSNTDLHVSLTTNSVLNNNGATGTGVLTDIDGNTRVHAWPPDIGADEFQGAYVLDLKVALQNCATGTFNVTIYDGSCGVLGTKSATITNGGPYDVVFNGINNATSIGAIKITHTNSLQIWSSSAAPFTNSKASYYFTTAQSQESGGNLVYNGTNWAMVSGDVNQDEAIDASDLSSVENDTECGDPGCASGYPTDLTCDDFVDAGDLAIVENNQGYFAAPVCGPAPAPQVTK